jgi:hypothetical protein
MSDLSLSNTIIDQTDYNLTNSRNDTLNLIDNKPFLSYEVMKILFIAIATITVLICITICLTVCICICLKRYVKIFFFIMI